MAQKDPQQPHRDGRRRALPVVTWLRAGAAMAAAGVALSGAPAANADEAGSSAASGSASAERSEAARGGAQSTSTAPRRGTRSTHAGEAGLPRPAAYARSRIQADPVVTAGEPSTKAKSAPAHAAATFHSAPPPAAVSPATRQRPTPEVAIAPIAQAVSPSGAGSAPLPSAAVTTVTTPAPVPAAPPRQLAPLPQAAAPAAGASSMTAIASGALTARVQNFFAALSDALPTGQFNNLLAGAMVLARRDGLGESVATAPAEAVTSNSLTAAAAADPAIRLAVFGDAGNSYTNGTNFYYAPGGYRRFDLGASGPMQQAVADMMRSWNPTDVIQLGDEAYNSASSTMLDYNIGQYYNYWIAPYAPPAFTQPGSIYTDGTLGGVEAVPGKTQWPYNLYNYPNGFPNPADPNLPGGSPDGVNHYFAVPGNHDEATILGTYNNASVNQVNFDRYYNGKPIGPDAYDYQNNIIKDPPYPSYSDQIDEKTGSIQALLDYHAYLGDGNPGNLKPGTLTIGKLDPDGYGMYYGVNLGDAGDGRPLIHLTIIDTSRLLTDAGYYKFNFAPNTENTTRDPNTGLQTANLTKNLNYDVRDPSLTAAQAWFQEPGTPLDAPSIGREMFLWAEQDLENSDAVWNILMGHHPAYHVGNTEANAEDSYTSNPAVLNFVQGLHDDAGAPLFDTYMNGHSHAYSRVLEMTPSADGIGTGIPFFTIGDGGKYLDALNLAPYGTDVLSPINFDNLVGAKGGAPLYNYDINKFGTTADPNSEASALAPYQAGSPTSVGVSGFYSYSKVNWPVGTGYDGTNPAKLTITSATIDPITGVAKTFSLEQPTYLSLLDPRQTDLSGLYGFGSGAAQVDAGDSYLMVHYQTAQPIDPAIALIGRGQGVTDFNPSTLFYKQWSPASAKAGDLGMFSVDVDADGSLTNVQLVNQGNGYFESDPVASSYLDVTQNFEILGNNPANPLGFSSSDPTRAVVQLTFSGGKLTGATLVDKGSGYQEVANAILQCNTCGSSTVATVQNPKNNSLLVGINIDMQAQYTLAAGRPTDSAGYHDWYMMTDTAVAGGSARSGGPFGVVDLSLLPTSQQARQLLADTPLTTGYTGKGPQQKYAAPQAGDLTLIDSLGQEVGTAIVEDGTAKATLNRLAAPGRLRVKFSGDATSSYQVNFRGIGLADNVALGLRYGDWTGPVAQQGLQLHVSQTQLVQVRRTDSGPGLVTLGLTEGDRSTLLRFWAAGAKSGSLQADDLFLTNPTLNWQSTEGRSLGSAGSARVAAGSWTPTARLNGRALKLESLQLTSNGALARFAAGDPNDPNDDVLATYTLPSTGKTTSTQNGVLTVRRLSGRADGVALYEADPVTGAVVGSKGRTFKPGQIGYLNAALDNAKQLGLVIKPQDMPAFGQTAERTDLSLDLNRNYGTLLMVNGSEWNMISSYSKANAFGTNQALSLIAPDRGVSYGFEDKRPWEWGADRDFNDVIVTLTPAVPTLTV